MSRPGELEFSQDRVNSVLRALRGRNKTEVRANWLSAVAARVTSWRPDLRGELLEVLGASPASGDILRHLSIGEIGVCYEALLASLDTGSRKVAGQYFTPDDTAAFMAGQSEAFPQGTWLDPCCGVGNLAWHLAGRQRDPGRFIREDLLLIDRDQTALKTAVALISAKYAKFEDEGAVQSLAARSTRRDFLSREPLPDFDFAIMNPPYARATPREGYQTASSRDLFAYFVERVATMAQGFIAVTPAAYLSSPKYAPVRKVLNEQTKSGAVFVFDNVPDTLFRGFKHGSPNTSRTNFVRAAITVCAPGARRWRITPILRWQTAQRQSMFEHAPRLLGPRREGPHGEWVKLVPGLEDTWDRLASFSRTLGDLVSPEPTGSFLEVATTPRYYISAAFRELKRGSKVRLYFSSAEDRDLAAVVLNSSIPYLWWRALDGGVTLPRRVLMSVPMPSAGDLELSPEAVRELADELRRAEETSVVTKLNAGRVNENVKHNDAVVAGLNRIVLPEVSAQLLEMVYTSSMFPLPPLATKGVGAT